MLERILDVKTKKLRSKIIGEFKSKWMDKSIQDATWEREKTFITYFPNVSLQECNVLKRGYVAGMNIKYSMVPLYSIHVDKSVRAKRECKEGKDHF